MTKATHAALTPFQEHIAAIEHDFLDIARWLGTAKVDEGRAALDAVSRGLHRLAEAARAVKAACPQCATAGAKMNFDAVNRYSGVWSVHECAACTLLMQIIMSVDAAMRSQDSTST
jgi:hypothetical protein